MKQKTRIRGTDIIRDIRSGQTTSELMKKYDISSKGLRSAFRKLLNLGFIEQEELNSRQNLFGASAGATGLRKVPRKRMPYSLWVYDAGNPSDCWVIRDISENGLCIFGLEAEIGETKTFMIQSGPLGRHSTFLFEATCRWIGGAEQNGEMVAGFEITNISPSDLSVLQSMLQ